MALTRNPALWLFPVVSLVCSGVGCPMGFGPSTGTGSTTQTSSGPTEVLLRLINLSGVDAEAVATFYVGTTAVRETTRLLPAAGAESTSLVVPTLTSLIHIVASEADASQLAARVGDTLADEEIQIGPEVAPGESIVFVIPPSIFVDCNNNGIADIVDVVLGTSADYNANEIPDECESPMPVAVVIGELRQIVQTDQDATTPTTLLDFSGYGLGSLRKLDVDWAGGHIYFTQIVSVSDGTVHRIPLAGGTPVVLISTQDSIGGIALDLVAGRMYWTSYIASPAGVRIASALLDGSNTSDVIAGFAGTIARPCVDPVNGKLFLTNNPPAGAYDFIQRANLDGTNVVDIVSNATDPRDVDVWPEASFLVWAEYSSSGGVFTADLDGNNATRIATVPNATGVAIDRANRRIYWTGEGIVGNSDGFVERANLDGSGVQRLLSSLDAPQDVAVYPVR